MRGRLAGNGVGFEGEVNDIVDHLEQRGLVVDRHDFWTGQHFHITEFLQHFYRGGDVPEALAVCVIEREYGRIDQVGAEQILGEAEAVGVVGNLRPVDAELVLVIQLDFQYGGLDQHLALGIIDQTVEIFLDLQVLRLGGANR